MADLYIDESQHAERLQHTERVRKKNKTIEGGRDWRVDATGSTDKEEGAT